MYGVSLNNGSEVERIHQLYRWLPLKLTLANRPGKVDAEGDLMISC
jgi:hypothetical protein